MVTNLRIFYPNGSNSFGKIQTQMRRGFGTLILEEIVKDSITSGSKLIHTHATTEYMTKFCLKKGFEECSEFKNTFYLLL